MILGFEEAGEGPALVLVHGFPADRRLWSAQVAGLSDIRRVVALDLPGRGRSADSPVPWDQRTMDSYADDVAETVDSLDVGPVDAGGISMGGYILFALWRRHPQVVRRLILVSTRATEDPPEGKQGRRNVAELVRQKGAAELIPMMFPKLFSPHAGPAVLAAAEQMVVDLPPLTAAADSLAMGKRPDSSRHLSSITVPTLVVHGGEDQLIPAQKAEEMAAQVPGSHFALVPDAGHFSPLENPAAVDRAIRKFLTGL